MNMTLVGDDGDHAVVQGVVRALGLAGAAGEVVAELVDAGAYAEYEVAGHEEDSGAVADLVVGD